jgi:hypothetical protein
MLEEKSVFLTLERRKRKKSLLVSKGVADMVGKTKTKNKIKN